MNAREFLAALATLAASRESGGKGDGIAGARLVNGIEYAVAETADERRLRAAWKGRLGGGATPLILVADDPGSAGRLRVIGPLADGPIRDIAADALRELVARTVAMKRLEGQRHLAQELERLDASGVAGFVVRGLGTEHLFSTRLRRSPRWAELAGAAADLAGADWRALLTQVGYELEQLPQRGYLVRHAGQPVAVLHPKRTAAEFARLDDEGRLPEGALIAACAEHRVDYGLLAAGTRLRLLATGREEAGAVARYLDLDTAAIDADMQPLLGLLAPAYLADRGLAAVLADGRDYGRVLRKRLDRVLRQDVLPILGIELGRWARAEGRDLTDDAVREELEAAALTFVFRALFMLYAESAGHLPMQNQTYRERSLTRVCERAWEEREQADPASTSLWRDIDGLVEAMRSGQRAWGVPAYNGDLFALDGFAGAGTLAAAAIPDAALGPALTALGRDPETPEIGVDFSGLEIGHLGHIYEGLLSLRLSVADRDYAYAAKPDRYLPADDDDEYVIPAGDLLWLTNEGGRKGGGVYYTGTELVRHLVRGAVGPAFDRHLIEVRDLAVTDPAAAAERLFDFHVLDPACGSAHFLVQVLDELSDKVAALLGDVALPDVRAALDDLRRGAAAFTAGVEDTALLKRLVLKRCVYGVDLSPMGAEIAKVSLWLASFVPGLSLAYLDNNIQVGNSLIGVARPEQVAPPEENGQVVLFRDAIDAALSDAAAAAAELRAIEDRTPDEVARSRAAHVELRARVVGAKRLFDLWTAEPLGLPGAREEVLLRGPEIVAAQGSLLADRAEEIAAAERVLHWPLAFAQVFARENPGFDAVIGNPPWDEITVEEASFYARFKPGIRRGISETTRRQEITNLISKRPDLPGRFESERRRAEVAREYLRAAGTYIGSGGDPDMYKYFCQRYQGLLREFGALGVVLPRSAFAAKGSEEFRRWLVEAAAPQRIDFLLNNRSWAFDIHPQYTVALLIAERRPTGPEERIGVAGVATSADAFIAQTARPALQLDRPALGPGLEVPLLQSQVAADLLAKLRRGDVFPRGAGRWACFPVAEFHETNDRSLWNGVGSGWPLWKGESFDQFDPRGSGQRFCPPSDDALAKARKPRPGGGSLVAEITTAEQRRAAVLKAISSARVAFRDVTQRTNSRTVISCVVPPAHFLVNSAPYLAFLGDEARSEAACLALMNSLPFDWQARRFVEIHMNFFILEGLRLPDLDDDTFDALATASARLSCPDERFADFAAATGVEYGPLTDDERTRLRVDIDARVARAWDLTAAELEVVFSDFTLDAVPETYRQLVRERFAELG